MLGEIRQPHGYGQNQIFTAYYVPFAEQAIARLAANALDQVQNHTDRNVASEKTLNDLTGHSRIPRLIV